MQYSKALQKIKIKKNYTGPKELKYALGHNFQDSHAPLQLLTYLDGWICPFFAGT